MQEVTRQVWDSVKTVRKQAPGMRLTQGEAWGVGFFQAPSPEQGGTAGQRESKDTGHPGWARGQQGPVFGRRAPSEATKFSQSDITWSLCVPWV